MCITKNHEGGVKDSETKRVFEEVMAKNFPNLAKDTNLQTQETEQTLKSIN